jgi:hypothetical protein
MRTVNAIAAALLMVGTSSLAVSARPLQPTQPTLTEVYQTLRSKQFVDLTHAFEPDIPHWPGFPDEKRDTLYWYDPGVGKLGSGFFAQLFCHVGQ